MNRENLLVHPISIRNGFLQYIHELNVSYKESKFYVRCSRCKQEFHCLPIFLNSCSGSKLTICSFISYGKEYHDTASAGFTPGARFSSAKADVSQGFRAPGTVQSGGDAVL